MLSALHSLAGLEALALTVARIWAVAGELLTAGAILWALDALARSIRLAYSMGRTMGRLLWPALHGLAAGGRWFAAHIDWAEVAAVVIDCLKALAVLCWLVAVEGRRFLIAASAAMGRRYAAALASAPSPVVVTDCPPVVVASAPSAPSALPVVAAPSPHPLAVVAASLEALTCRELRALTGTRRKLPKASLVALALALA
jgi:hypothetical protein